MTIASTIPKIRGKLITPLAHVAGPAVGGGATFPHFKGLQYDLEAALDLSLDVVSGDFYAAPMQIPAGTTFDRVGINAAGGPVTVRLGIYEDDLVFGGPGALLFEVGTVATAVGYAENAAITPVTIWKTGLYWLGILAEGTVTLNGLRGGGLFKGRYEAGGPESFMGWGYSRTGAGAGSMPDPAATTTLVPVGPNMVLRVAADGCGPMEMPPKRLRSAARHLPKTGEIQIEGIRTTDTPAAASATVPDDGLVVIPMVLHKAVHVVQMAMPSLAFANTKQALYDSRPDNTPGDLLCSFSGAVVPALDFWLGPGLFWRAFHNKTGGNFIDNNPVRCDGETVFSVAGASYPSGAAYKIDAGAALPNPFVWSGMTDLNPFPRLAIWYDRFAEVAPAASRLRRFVPTYSHLYAPLAYVGPCAYEWDFQVVKVILTANVWAILWPVEVPTTYDQVGINIADSTGAPTLDLSIYEDDGQYHPGRKIRDLGQVGPVGAGDNVVAIASDLHLSPGNYWLVVDNTSGITTAEASHLIPWARYVEPRGSVGIAYMGWIAPTPAADPWTNWTPEAMLPNLFMRVKYRT